ncbi:hypothetical protein BJ165DRAFT_1409100 [Panaeolus papilionaceus]|nr:hypothetical protein BJ165DRAFT_1409100 [Panaeolus papilionaceus]
MFSLSSLFSLSLLLLPTLILSHLSIRFNTSAGPVGLVLVEIRRERVWQDGGWWTNSQAANRELSVNESWIQKRGRAGDERSSFVSRLSPLAKPLSLGAAAPLCPGPAVRLIARLLGVVAGSPSICTCTYGVSSFITLAPAYHRIETK